MFCFTRCAFDDEGVSTITSREQLKTEDIVTRTFENWQYKLKQDPQNVSKMLNRGEHVKWLLTAIRTLPPMFLPFACTHPWVVFWILQALALLDISPIPGIESLHPTSDPQSTQSPQSSPTTPQSTSTPLHPAQSDHPSPAPQPKLLDSGIWTKEFGTELIDFVCRFQHPTLGGFAGQFGGEPHILTTYASVMSIMIAGSRCQVLDHAFASINFTTLRSFFLSMKVSNPSDPNFGAFQSCPQGEIDTRSAYCCLASLDILGMLPDPELTSNLVPWLSRCSNYDGGFSSEPCVESHGGYTFCGLAALLILERPNAIKLDVLEKWCVTKQLEKEGGFCGRTCKLVDSCYSFWVGATIPLIHIAREQIKYIKQVEQCQKVDQDDQTVEGDKHSSNNTVYTLDNFSTLFHQPHIHSCNLTQQCNEVVDVPTELGWLFDQQALQSYINIVCQDRFGFKDKPGKNCDLYHTCYSLSGLAVAQCSTPHGKASYIYHTPPDQSLTIPTLPTSPQVSLQTQHNQTSTSDPTETLPESTPSTTSQLGYSYPIPLLPSTEQLIEQYKQPVTFRLGGQYAKLQQNNPIYNIPQRCYLLTHAYLQLKKSSRQ